MSLNPFEKDVVLALADAIDANKAALEAEAAPLEAAGVAAIIAQANAFIAKLPPLEAAILKAVAARAEAQAEPFVNQEVNLGIVAVVAWLKGLAA
jgi:hypothetical protein